MGSTIVEERTAAAPLWLRVVTFVALTLESLAILGLMFALEFLRGAGGHPAPADEVVPRASDPPWALIFSPALLLVVLALVAVARSGNRSRPWGKLRLTGLIGMAALNALFLAGMIGALFSQDGLMPSERGQFAIYAAVLAITIVGCVWVFRSRPRATS